MNAVDEKEAEKMSVASGFKTHHKIEMKEEFISLKSDHMTDLVLDHLSPRLSISTSQSFCINVVLFVAY